MGRKEKIKGKVKIDVVEKYLEGLISINDICLTLNVGRCSVKNWVRKYRTFGPEGLINNCENTNYSEKTKLAAINDYLNGEGSLSNICDKYKISSLTVLHRWIKKYNSSHKICKSQNKKGDKIMTKGRKTTYEERVDIVSFCIANAKDYNLTADKFKVSYQQVYGWVKKYESMGLDGLVDRRGQHREFDELNESQKFTMQLKLLEAENRRLKLENEFLKKLEEIERR